MNASALQRLPVILLAAALLATTVVIVLTLTRRNEAGVPQLRRGTEQPDVRIALPPFSLTDTTGRPFGSEQLKGTIWIADFIFTRCGGPCPAMTTQMAGLQQRLRSHRRWADIRLVSVSVDPGFDTPQVLADYARRYQADPDHWRFLTGTQQQVWTLIRNGFKLPVFENTENASMPIVHSQKFVLVDRDGNIRGYYEGLDEQQRAELLNALEQVLGEITKPE
ncbi:MAG: SCO family protein [Phycisphaeraceae bacterium]